MAVLQPSNSISLSPPPIKKRKPRSFWLRKWHKVDIFMVIAMVTVHSLCLLAPFYFTWPAFWVGVTLFLTAGWLGLTLSYHRQLTHKSFTLPKWLEYTFAYFGVHALEGDPMFWVSTHRYHHKFVDTERDPHSPKEGFWFSHIMWLFDKQRRDDKYGNASNVADLRKQAFYRFLRKTYLFHPLGLGTLLYSYGGMPYLVWGMGVRIVVHIHIIFFVNSVCHLWGDQAWNTGDDSRNNWLFGILAFGDGWHNNHHAFPSSARHGLEWWQLDMTWNVIKLLEALGLATNVKLPSERQMKKLAWTT